MNALSEEINMPGFGILDKYLLQFKESQSTRSQWGKNILEIKGIDGLTDLSSTAENLTDTTVAEKYRKFDEKRQYFYAEDVSLSKKVYINIQDS